MDLDPPPLMKLSGSTHNEDQIQHAHMRKAPVPKSLRPQRDFLATDFVWDLCDHCNCFSTTGMVADHLPISRRPVSDLSPTNRQTKGDLFAFSRRSATSSKLFYHSFKNKMFGKNKHISIQVAIMIAQ